MSNKDQHQPGKVNGTDRPASSFFANMIDQENVMLGLPLKTVTKRTWRKESNSTINLPVNEQEQDLNNYLIMETINAVKNEKAEGKNNGLYSSISSEDRSKFSDFFVSENYVSNKEEEESDKDLGIVKEFQTKLRRAREEEGIVEKETEDEKNKRETISLDLDKLISHNKEDSIGKNQSEQMDKTSSKAGSSVSYSSLSEEDAADDISSIPYKNTRKSNFVSKEQTPEEGVKEKQGEKEEKDTIPSYIAHDKIVSDNDIKSKEQNPYDINNNTSVSDIDGYIEKKQLYKKKMNDYNKQIYLNDINTNTDNTYNNNNDDDVGKRVPASFDKSSLQEKKKTSEGYGTQEVDVSKSFQNKEFSDKTNKNSNTSKYSNSFSSAVLANEKNKNLERDFAELLKMSSYINDDTYIKKTSAQPKNNMSQESSNLLTAATAYSTKSKIAPAFSKSKQKLSDNTGNPYQQNKGTFTKKNVDSINTQNRVTRLSIGNINIQISNLNNNKNNLSRRVESTSTNSFSMASDLDTYNKTYQWRLHD